MANSTKRRKARGERVVAALWIRSVEQKFAPPYLGGLSLEEQERIILERVEADGYSLVSIFIIVGTCYHSVDKRVQELLAILNKTHPVALLVTKGTFIGAGAAELKRHLRAFEELGTELVICDD